MNRGIDLIKHLPEILQGVREFKQLAAVENPEIEKLWACLEDALNDQFVGSATTYGLKRWERMLKILPKATDTPNERRFRILTRLNEQLPYSWRMLVQQLTTLCGPDGYSMELKNDEYTLVVKVALTAKSNFDDVGDLLGRIVPANLVIDLNLKYNQHKLLSGFTHHQLKRHTHKELREEVIAARSGGDSSAKTVTGVVWPMVSDDLELGEWFLRLHDITVELRSTFNNPAEAALSTTATYEGSDQGKFTIENVPFGEYVLYIKRPGYLARCMVVTVSVGSPDLILLSPPGNEGRFNLWWGDVNDDGSINARDAMMIREYIELQIDALHPDYNPACDLNSDGLIDNFDTMMVSENLGKNILQYPGAEDVDINEMR